MIFTGVGSRDTPKDILEEMFQIAVFLGKKNWILRSGGADGADSAFEKGMVSINGKTEIYLPWKNFNKHNSPLYQVTLPALDMASQIHPIWDNLSVGAQKLHARNCYQVLGFNLNKPSDLLICWTLEGKDVGGTATAIKLARKYNVPIINLGKDKFDYEKFTITK